MKKRRTWRRTLLLAGLLTAALSVGAGAAEKMNLEEVEVAIPGLTGEYQLVFLADLHIAVDNEEVGQEHRETVSQREQLFVDESGTASQELWQELTAEIEELEPDAVLLGGDMMDFASEANMKEFRAGLETLTSPLLYVRADHDYGVWYETMEKKEARAMHRELDGNQRVPVLDLGEFLVVGVNNNTSQISDKALEDLKEVFSRGKPIVLMLHVPLESRVDQKLKERSREAWQDRELLWGENTYYQPKENTREFLEMVYEKNSPVVQVLSGHLHFSYQGALTDKINQYVADPAYLGRGALIRIHG